MDTRKLDEATAQLSSCASKWSQLARASRRRGGLRIHDDTALLMFGEELGHLVRITRDIADAVDLSFPEAVREVVTP